MVLKNSVQCVQTRGYVCLCAPRVSGRWYFWHAPTARRCHYARDEAATNKRGAMHGPRFVRHIKGWMAQRIAATGGEGRVKIESTG